MGSIEETITSDMKVAMKAGDRSRTTILRTLLAPLRLAQKTGGDDELTILRREHKRRQEAMISYRKANREDLAEQEEQEAQIIERYLPAPLDEKELQRIIGAVIDEVGATSAKDFGLVMKVVMSEVNGRSDGKTVSAAVKQHLQ